ncbi:MAG: ABC transporter permease, partial [Dongiaceae bacterium]
MKPGRFEETRDGDRLVLAAVGAWTIDAAKPLDAALRRLSADGLGAARIDLGGLEALDTAGAWLLARTGRILAEAGVEVTIGGAAPHHAQIFDRVVEAGPPPLSPARRATPVDAVARLGKQVVDALRQGRDLLGFFGAVVVTALRVLRNPGRIRFVSFVHHLEQVGLNALPIVGLLAFLIGVVVAYQGVDQLRRFGAQIFTVNLLGISVLR